MSPILSEQLNADLDETVSATLRLNGIVNINTVAEAIRRRHAVENVALEDIAYAVLTRVQLVSGTVEFDSMPASHSWLDGDAKPAV